MYVSICSAKAGSKALRLTPDLLQLYMSWSKNPKLKKVYKPPTAVQI